MPTTIPTTTSSTRPGSPSAGDAYFETDTKNYIIYDGTNWRGYNNDGVLTPFTGNLYALDFDGTDDYLDISGIATSIDSWTDVSWSAWYKGTASSGYIFRASPAGSANPHIGMSISSNSVFGVVTSNNTSNANNVTHQTTINDGSWHHLAVTFNGTTGDINVYVDGVVNSATPSKQGTPSIGTGYTAANVGRRPSSSHLYTVGLIDEFAIWDAELTSTEVGNLKTTSGVNNVPANISSIGRSGNGPIGWWRMGDNNGGTGSTITDLGKDSGGNDSGNDGTIVNAPLGANASGAAFHDLSTAPDTIYFA